MEDANENAEDRVVDGMMDGANENVDIGNAPADPVRAS